jgi:PilZ domain
MSNSDKTSGPKVRPIPAWIVINGRADCECQVLDMTPKGAKVVVQASPDVSNRFELAFFADAGKRRSCEVIWRRGKMLGVRFLS